LGTGITINLLSQIGAWREHTSPLDDLFNSLLDKG
jgi:hypothetical protein